MWYLFAGPSLADAVERVWIKSKSSLHSQVAATVCVHLYMTALCHFCMFLCCLVTWNALRFAKQHSFAETRYNYFQATTKQFTSFFCCSFNGIFENQLLQSINKHNIMFQVF